jgi:PmbA protein
MAIAPQLVLRDPNLIARFVRENMDCHSEFVALACEALFFSRRRCVYWRQSIERETAMPDAAGASAQDLETLADLIAAAKKAGADAADAVLFRSLSLEVSYRMGRPEDLERSESQDLGLRVFVDGCPAVVSSTDLSAKTLEDVVARAIAMAKAAPPDPYAGLVDQAMLNRKTADLDLYDPTEPTPDELYAQAEATEAAALSVTGVTNSEGAGAGYGTAAVALATSDGFAGGYGTSSHSVSVSVLAGEGTGMERDYEFSSARHRADLDDPEAIGRSAGERAVKRLHPRKVDSRQVPVVFEPRVSRSILGHFAGAISGQSVARGTSFLKDSMGQEVFPAAIDIVDDPHRLRGLASKPFDGEGAANPRLDLVSGGKLQHWLLDSASARQLGIDSNGRASRGTGGPPSPSSTNLYMANGEVSPEDLIGAIDDGLYVTELIGFGVNGVTGDYSRGAGGFWIEKGKLSYPVSELTIAGNLKDMFRQVTPADDLVFRYGSNAPTLRLDGMTVAGA